MTENTIMRELNDNRYSYHLEWRLNKRTKISRIVIIRIAKLKTGHRKKIVELSPIWRNLSESQKILIGSSPKHPYHIFNKNFINSKFENINKITLQEAINTMLREKEDV